MTNKNTNGQMRSDLIKGGPDHAPARAMLRATGLDDEAIARPLIGIAHSWSNVSPCNLNLRDLAAAAADGVRAAGGTPFEFNTIAVTDGIAMGSPGMRASLVSREIIADSIELAVEGHCLDAVLVLCGCDKTIPAAAMALARMNLPGLALYGGTIPRYARRQVNPSDVFEAVGAHGAGKLGQKLGVERRSVSAPAAPVHCEHDGVDPDSRWPLAARRQ
jgi:dihydroxy-acid dehydratase